MRRVNLNRDPVTTLADLIEGARSTAEGAHTRPTGSIFLQDYANISWFDSEAHERSIRELDSEMSQLDVDLALNAEELAAARDRLDQARVDLDAGLAVIDAAEESLTALTGDLSELDSRLTEDVSKAIEDAAAAKAAGDAAHTLATKATKDAASANDAAAKAWDTALATANAGGNLILNGSFEQNDGTPTAIKHWPAPAVGRYRYYTGSSNARSGTALMEIEESADVNVWPLCSPMRRDFTGRSIYAECWFRRALAGPNGRSRVGIYVLARLASGAQKGLFIGRAPVSDFPVDGQYRKVSGVVTFPDYGEPIASVEIAPWAEIGGHRWWIDDLMALDVTEAMAAEAKAEAAAKAAQAAQGTAADAKRTAEVALASAAGGAMRYSGLVPPTFTTDPDSGKPVTRGSTYWQWDGSESRNAIGQWVYDGSAWLREGIRSEVIANLDVNKLTVSGSARMTQAVVDKIIGDAAHFGLLTAERVLIGVDNMVPNGNFARKAESGMPVGFEFGSSWRWRPDWHGGSIQALDTTAAKQTSLPFEVTAGTTYRGSVTAWAAVNGAATYIQMVYADPKIPSEYVVNKATVNAAATPLSWEWTPKASGMVTMRVYPNHPSGAASPYMLYGPFEMRPKVGGELLVDGSIGARHIMADEVAGAVGKFIELDVGQLTATGTSTLSDVVAQHIAGRSAQFIELDVGNLVVTENTNLNKLVAQHIASATGAFQQVYTENIVSRGGTFDTAVIRDLVAQMISSELFVAGSRTGQRIEITGDGLRAYDAYGTETASLGGSRNAFWVGEKRAGTGRKGIGLSQIGASDSYGLVLTSPGGTRSAPAVFSDRDGELTLTSGTASGVEQFLMWMNSVGIFAGTAGQAVTNSPSFRITSDGVQVPGKWFSRSEVSGDWGPLAGGSYTLTGTQANLPIAGRRYALEVTEFAGGAKAFFAIDDIDGRAWTTAKRHDGTFTGWKAAN